MLIERDQEAGGNFVADQGQQPLIQNPAIIPNFNYQPIPEVEGFHPSLNQYKHKKLIAQGLLDIALLSANSEQLRYILDNKNHEYFYVSVTLISISLVLQIIVAMVLVFKSKYNIDEQQGFTQADKIDNVLIVAILLITVVNVMSSAFAPPEKRSVFSREYEFLTNMISNYGLY